MKLAESPAEPPRAWSGSSTEERAKVIAALCLTPTTTASDVGEAVTDHAVDFSFSSVESEEGEVWKVTRRGDLKPLAWVKRHAQPAKSAREREAMRRWGCALGAPKILAELDECTLLLEHCEGEPLNLETLKHIADRRDLIPQLGASLGAQLASLHSIPFVDPDPVTLAEAIRARSRASLRDLDQVTVRLERVTSSPELRLAYLQMIERVTEMAERGLKSLPHELEWARSLLRERVPCHRDLTSAHILCKFERSAPLQSVRKLGRTDRDVSRQLRVIDWGQSRPDHWASDWAKLYVDWRDAPLLWRAAWRSYWRQVSATITPHQLNSDERELERYALNVLSDSLATLALGSLRWSTRHRGRTRTAKGTPLNELVWRRGLNELSAFVTLESRLRSALE